MADAEKRIQESQRVMAWQRKKREEFKLLAAGIVEILDRLPSAERARIEAEMADRIEIARAALASAQRAARRSGAAMAA